MKRIIKLLLLYSIFAGPALVANTEGGQSTLLDGVGHFNQSTIRILGNKVIYFDPFAVSGETHDGDIVFITHTHGDHLSIPDLKKVAKPDVTVVIPEDGAPKVRAAGITRVVTVSPAKEYEALGIKFATVPAYNINKNFHPRSSNWVGYIVSINNSRYYIAGDTDLIAEMKGLQTDVAFLPVGGTYTMSAEEAARAAGVIKPKIAVPIHFGDVVGSVGDAKKFINLLDKGIEGVILKK